MNTKDIMRNYMLGIAMEAPVDVTGATNDAKTAALGADAKTNDPNSNRRNMETDLDGPGDLLDGPSDDMNDAEEPDNPEDETGGEGDEENAEDPDAEGEDTGEEGGDEDGTTDDDTPIDDTSDDPDAIKKRRLMENLQELHKIIQKNATLLSNCNVRTVSATTGQANNKIIQLLNDTADIIYNLLTDGTADKLSYAELMQKYIGMNMVFDIAIKMLEGNIKTADKIREKTNAAAQRQAKRAMRQVSGTTSKSRNNLDGTRP